MMNISKQIRVLVCGITLMSLGSVNAVYPFPDNIVPDLAVGESTEGLSTQVESVVQSVVESVPAQAVVELPTIEEALCQAIAPAASSAAETSAPVEVPAQEVDKIAAFIASAKAKAPAQLADFIAFAENKVVVLKNMTKADWQEAGKSYGIGTVTIAGTVYLVNAALELTPIKGFVKNRTKVQIGGSAAVTALAVFIAEKYGVEVVSTLTELCNTVIDQAPAYITNPKVASLIAALAVSVKFGPRVVAKAKEAGSQALIAIVEKALANPVAARNGIIATGVVAVGGLVYGAHRVGLIDKAVTAAKGVDVSPVRNGATALFQAISDRIPSTETLKSNLPSANVQNAVIGGAVVAGTVGGALALRHQWNKSKVAANAAVPAQDTVSQETATSTEPVFGPERRPGMLARGYAAASEMASTAAKGLKARFAAPVAEVVDEQPNTSTETSTQAPAEQTSVATSAEAPVVQTPAVTPVVTPEVQTPVVTPVVTPEVQTSVQAPVVQTPVVSAPVAAATPAVQAPAQTSRINNVLARIPGTQARANAQAAVAAAQAQAQAELAQAQAAAQAQAEAQAAAIAAQAQAAAELARTKADSQARIDAMPNGTAAQRAKKATLQKAHNAFFAALK